MGGLIYNGVKPEEKDINDLVVMDDVGFNIYLKDVFPAIVEKVKLFRANFTGDKKEVKAFFNTFHGKPQVTFKYGQKYYVFNFREASDSDREYARSYNFK